jgi:hypothetical protein
MRSKFAATATLLAMLAIAGFATTSAQAADVDCDTVADSADNCPVKFNPAQGDIDGDFAGDACDPDKDGDGLENVSDNCIRHANAGQQDADTDGAGDACDQCVDTPAGDIANSRGCTVDQLCPCDGPTPEQAWRDADQFKRCVKRKLRNFRRQHLVTSDQAGEIMDAARSNGCGTLTPQQGDNDGDAVADVDDNCVSKSNPSQLNTDGDALGDACDTDRDNDGVLNRDDNCPVVVNDAGQGDDADGDTVGDACDACPGTGLAAAVDRDGCSIGQICLCDVDDDGNPWAGHSRYTRCVADEVFRFRQARILTGEQADAIRDSAAASSCGERNLICE